MDIETCYSLEAGARYITLDSTFTNQGGDELPIYLTEYLNGSGQVEFFQPYLGFGEPTYTPSCPVQTYVACDESPDGPVRSVQFRGLQRIDGASGVSYGLIYNERGSSSFSTAGINIVVYGDAALSLILGIVPPNYSIPADGALSLRRYFAVGDGTVASITDIRDELFGMETSAVSGVVASNGEPVADARWWSTKC